MKNERLNSDDFSLIKFAKNYSNKQRDYSPIMKKERKPAKYYIIEECPNKSLLNKSINEDLYNSQYQNYTNPINYIKQYPNYMTSNNFYPSRQNMVYYENVIPPGNKYLYNDNKYNYNYTPNFVPQSANDRIYMNMDQMSNINEFQKENNINPYKNKIKADKYKNGINLNISNFETQYPLTYLNDDPYHKRKPLIQNYIKKYMMNFKSPDDFPSQIFKKNKDKKIVNISQIKPLINITEEQGNISFKNNNNEQDSISSSIYHKKNKSQRQFDNNVLKGEYYQIYNNNKNDRNISINNYYNNIYESTKGRINKSIFYDDERSRNTDESYKCPKFDITTKIQRNRSKNRSIGKNSLKKFHIQERYITKLKIFINHLEQYYILSFQNYFRYFIGKLKTYKKSNFDKNKDLLLKRFQRVRNNRSDFLYKLNNISPNKDATLNNINNIKKIKKINNISYLINNRSVYIPKKNIYQGHDQNNLTLNSENSSTINFKEFNNLKNVSSRNKNKIPSESNLSSYYNSVNNYNKIDKKKINQDYSVDNINKKRNDFIYKNKNNLNKSQDNSYSFNRRLNISNDRQKTNTSANNSLNKNSMIYIKPKAKMNLKKAVSRNKSGIKKSLNDKEDLSSILNESIFKNDKNINKTDNKINYNALYNNSFNINDNIDSLRSPIKSNKYHTRNISDIAQEVIDNANINTNKKSNQKTEKNGISDGNSDISNGNDNINEDIIEEIIIKDINTYDKRLSVFIKYIISPKAKQKFLKMKLQRRLKNIKNIDDKKGMFLLEFEHTDSFELLSPLSILNSHFKYSEYSNQRKMEMKEVKEISEENESNNNSAEEDENNYNKLLKMINILEKYRNENILYFKEYFFGQMSNCDSNIETLTQRDIFNNIKNNFQALEISNLSDNDNNYNLSSFIKEDNNKEDNENENQKNNYNKTGENWNNNLNNNLLGKDRSFNNEEENYFSGNIKMVRKKLLNFNKINDICKKRNSVKVKIEKNKLLKNVIKDKDPEAKKEEFDLRRRNKLKLIILRKMNHFKYNKRAKRHFLRIWRNNKNINDNNQNTLNNKDNNEDENLIKMKEKINNFRLHLIKYTFKNSEEENDEEDEEEEDDDGEESEKNKK